MFRHIKFPTRQILPRTLLLGLWFFGAWAAAPAQAPEDAPEIGISELPTSQIQQQANALIARGDLSGARPLLLELIRRFETAEGEAPEIPLDGPYFLVGTAYVQEFAATSDRNALVEAVKWYDRLENEYPETTYLKDALTRKVELLRALGEVDRSLELMEAMLDNKYNFQLRGQEMRKMVLEIARTYYSEGKLERGLPYFIRLVQVANDSENRALGAAATFEAYFDQIKSGATPAPGQEDLEPKDQELVYNHEQIDAALKLLPILAQESEVRYRPRFNVSLLGASDILVEADRFSDATLILSLIKTTDVAVQWHEAQIAEMTDLLARREGTNAAPEIIEDLKRNIEIFQARAEQLRKLPTLRNDLLVRRARNYTATERLYEAFWMFYDLFKENPGDVQAEFFHYAAFSNAVQTEKAAMVQELGKAYRETYPQGTYYSDVTVALTDIYLEEDRGQEFLATTEDFLASRPNDSFASQMLVRWANYLFQEGDFNRIIDRLTQWALFEDAAYADGVMYWSGLARIQLGDYLAAAEDFQNLLTAYPESQYAEDALLRRGAALFYAQDFEAARSVINSYIRVFPDGSVLDQAHYFLAEMERIVGNLDRALASYQRSEELTSSLQLFDAIAFKRGSIYEAQGKFAQMESNFREYIDRFGPSGQLTDAIFELGRALEYQINPVAMLELYREAIREHGGNPDSPGIDQILEAYAERYEANKVMLTETVDLLRKLDNDTEFRTQFVTDRGFLFDVFWENQQIDQRLYNALRLHPKFDARLTKGMGPVSDLTQPYREQLTQYPPQTPEAFFRSLLREAVADGDWIRELRALMGLYRSGVEIEPSQALEEDLLDRVTPRVLLYLADYQRPRQLDFAIKAWEKVLERYPYSDSAIVALLNLASDAEERGELQLAVDRLQQVREQFPGSPKLPAVILRQGELYSRMDQHDRARAEYDYLLRVPEWRGEVHAQALLQTGRSFEEEGVLGKAHGYYERVFLAYPHIAKIAAEAYLADARVLVRLGAPKDAINTLQEALDLLLDSAPEALLQSIREELAALRS